MLPEVKLEALFEPVAYSRAGVLFPWKSAYAEFQEVEVQLTKNFEVAHAGDFDNLRKAFQGVRLTIIQHQCCVYRQALLKSLDGIVDTIANTPK